MSEAAMKWLALGLNVSGLIVWSMVLGRSLATGLPHKLHGLAGVLLCACVLFFFVWKDTP